MVLSFCLGMVHLGWFGSLGSFRVLFVCFLVFFKDFFYKYRNHLYDCELDAIRLTSSNIIGGEEILTKLSWKCMHLVFRVLAQL